MKDSSEYAARLARLCNRLQRRGGKASVPELQDVTTELLLGCLSGYMTENKARSALNKLRSNFVDYNELRVTRPAEVVEILGRGYSQVRPAVEQMLCLLRSVFDEQDHLDLEHLKELGKREARSFLEELEGSTVYVVSRVMLRGLQGHAFPLHDQMLKMLRGEEVVEETADEATVQGFLERQISAKKILKVYTLLRRHADNFKGLRAAKKTGKTAARKTASKRKK
ncbi:MAG: hypothetical protein AMJ79_08710 [Phycisphaerae bacterium SM23_30]|nr:MAG: hypothetical protein AMJ79_08710 [Phycisphaerae bacterium SM23_30]